MNNKKLVTLRKRMSNLITGYWKTQTVFTAVKLGVIESLAEKSKTAREIAVERNLDEKATESLLWALQSLKIIHYDQNLVISLTEFGRLLLKEQKGSMAYASLVWGSEHYNTWRMLPKSIKSGKPAFKRIYGNHYFNWLDKHPDRAIEYHKAMAEYAEIDYQSFVEKIDFGQHSVVMDVGGGQGILLANILSRYPGAKGILIEKPLLEGLARDLFCKKKVVNRCSIVKHDFSQPLPHTADAILLCRVIHDWDDDSAVKILQNCRDALNPHGKVYVVELRVPEGETSFGALLNLNMLVITGGKERTKKEYKLLGKQSGLVLLNVIQLESISSVFIFESDNIPSV